MTLQSGVHHLTNRLSPLEWVWCKLGAAQPCLCLKLGAAQPSVTTRDGALAVMSVPNYEGSGTLLNLEIMHNTDIVKENLWKAIQNGTMVKLINLNNLKRSFSIF